MQSRNCSLYVPSPIHLEGNPVHPTYGCTLTETVARGHQEWHASRAPWVIETGRYTSKADDAYFLFPLNLYLHGAYHYLDFPCFTPHDHAHQLPTAPVPAQPDVDPDGR